ncbi:MAG: tetratricopeptide repeat protein, partial [Promethearchaeia archaeon]
MPVDPYTGQVSPRVVPPGPPSTIAAARAEHLALGLHAPAHLDARGVSASPHPMTMCLSLQESGHLSIFSSNPNRPSDFRCEISKEGPWHAYVLLRAEAWASHTLRSDEKKCGIRSVITKTETRGPYTRPFTVYFVHTKTAFKVKSVCKRFSDFKELHQKLKGKHSTFDTQFPPDQVFNSMSPEFVSERRKQLQTYLDEAMAMDHIATDPDLHDFLGIPEYNAQANEEQHKQQQREHKPEDLKPETFLKVIEKAKLDGDRVSEAQGFNALGLLYCESGLENEGMQCLESSLELCRHMGNTEGMIVTLSNLGCLYNLLDRSQFAVGPFQECFDLLEGDPAGQGEAQMKLSLTCAANGDNYEAIEHCLQCLKLCRQLNDHNKEASCLFTLGSIYYEAGEVRQAVEAFEQCLRDLDVRAPLETANHMQEKLEHKNVPVIHGQTLLNHKKL